ncbi:hypothetical protein BHM03_00024319 [Ensete ventricosum]|nr:hypothetical protein BHM03_00024319 [Ensete ventricosum]
MRDPRATCGAQPHSHHGTQARAAVGPSHSYDQGRRGSVVMPCLDMGPASLRRRRTRDDGFSFKAVLDNGLLWPILSHPPALRPRPRRLRRGHPRISAPGKGARKKISPKSPNLSPSVPARRTRLLLPNRFGLRMAKKSMLFRIGIASRSHIEVAGLVVDKDETH